LFVMATDWYTTKQGESRREAERIAKEAERAFPGEAEKARQLAEEEERNAWQEDGAIDRLLLISLLATVAVTVFAAVAYAAGRRSDDPLTPSVAVIGLTLLSELLVTYRIIQEPDVDSITEVGAGPPLALVCLGLVSLGGFLAMQAEQDRPRRAPFAGWRSEEEDDQGTTAAGVDATTGAP
jgi:hypothetical protein